MNYANKDIGELCESIQCAESSELEAIKLAGIEIGHYHLVQFVYEEINVRALKEKGASDEDIDIFRRASMLFFDKSTCKPLIKKVDSKDGEILIEPIYMLIIDKSTGKSFLKIEDFKIVKFENSKILIEPEYEPVYLRDKCMQRIICKKYDLALKEPLEQELYSILWNATKTIGPLPGHSLRGYSIEDDETSVGSAYQDLFEQDYEEITLPATITVEDEDGVIKKYEQPITYLELPIEERNKVDRKILASKGIPTQEIQGPLEPKPYSKNHSH